MKQKVILIGAGGHAKVIADIIRASGDIVVGFYDDKLPKGTVLRDVAVLGALSDINIAEPDTQYIIAVGDNTLRKKIAVRFAHLPFYTAVHPCAQLGSNVKVGFGSCVMPLAVIQADAVIGEHCIINTHSVLEHDGRLENYVHLAPGCTLCGTVHVGECSMIGAGAVVRNNINIASNCIVGAGAAVIKDILDAGTYVGVPAGKLKGV